MKVVITTGIDGKVYVSVEGDTLVESTPKEIAKAYKAVEKELNKEESSAIN